MVFVKHAAHLKEPEAGLVRDAELVLEASDIFDHHGRRLYLAGR